MVIVTGLASITVALTGFCVVGNVLQRLGFTPMLGETRPNRWNLYFMQTDQWYLERRIYLAVGINISVASGLSRCSAPGGSRSPASWVGQWSGLLSLGTASWRTGSTGSAPSRALRRSAGPPPAREPAPLRRRCSRLPTTAEPRGRPAVKSAITIVTVLGARPQFIKAAVVSPGADGARGVPRGAAAHRAALRRADVGRLLRGAGDPGADLAPRHRLGSARRSRPGRMLEAIESVLARSPARLGAGLRRHQLDARRRAGRRQAAHPGRARRGGPALLQPHDAGGDQPDR